MVEYLEAPFPYIVGVPRDLWRHIFEQKWDILGEEVVAFDIDNNRVYNKEDLPEFPQPYTNLLIKQLENQLDKSKQIMTNRNINEEEKTREEERFWNNFTLKVKQQFLNFLIFLINNFESFYVSNQQQAVVQNQNNNSKESLKSKPSSKDIVNSKTAASTIDNHQNSTTGGDIGVKNNNFAPGGSANDIFNFDEYLLNIKHKGFFEKFVRTQAFINFIEQAYYEEQGNINDASIRFFKECTRKLAKENIQSVRALQDNIIVELMNRFNNKSISYSISKCHQLYDKALRINMQAIGPDSFIQNLNTNPTSSQTNTSNQKLKGFGVIGKLDHSKIVKMTAFDPIPHLTQQYMKGEETYFKVDRLKPRSSKKSFKLNLNQSAEDLPETNINVFNANDYFTAQITPKGGGMFRIQQKSTFEANMNRTQEHIMIDEEHQDLPLNEFKLQGNNYNDQQEDPYDNDIVDDDLQQEKEPGFMGFFKKTISSMKKTLFSSKSKKREPSIKEPEYVDSPDMKNCKENNKRRSGRSQTFHLASLQPQQTRDRKNNDSFFVNLINLATNKKDKTQDDANGVQGRDVRSAMNQTADLKRLNNHLNASGFFVFNEEDMKNMTEMSPKNGIVKVIPESRNFEQRVKEDENQQITHRQQPQIKSPPQYNINGYQMSNRVRSISYQNQKELSSFSEIKKNMKIMELINESVSSIQIDDNNLPRDSIVPSRLNFASPKQGNNINLQNEIEKHISQSPPLSARVHHKSQQAITMIKQVKDLKTPQIFSNNGSARKDPHIIKKEFEEIYKKSTENLFYAPPNKNDQKAFKDKHVIWKSQTGKLDPSMVSKSQKPPKHQNFGTSKKSANGPNYKSSYKMIQPLVSPKQPRFGEFKSNQNSFQEKISSMNAFNEEFKILQNENNTTDEDSKQQIVGKVITEFQKGMTQNDGYEKKSQSFVNNVHKEQQKIEVESSSLAQGTKNQTQQQKHKRQISHLQQQQSTTQVKQTLKNEIKQQILNLNGSPHENIEPDEGETKQSQNANHKQIESMQIGRARKKSKNNISANNYHTGAIGNISATHQNIQQQFQGTTIHNQRSNNRNQLPQQMQRKSTLNNTQRIQSAQTAQKLKIDLSKPVLRSKKSQQINTLIRGDEVDQEQYDNEINDGKDIFNIKIQQQVCKTGQTSSNTSSINSHSAPPIGQQNLIQLERQTKINQIAQERKKEVSKYIVKKSQEGSSQPVNNQQFYASNKQNSSDNYTSKSDVALGDKINNFHSKTKIDFREARKGEMLKVNAGGTTGSVSPINNSTVHNFTHQSDLQHQRIHSFSQVHDVQNILHNKILNFQTNQPDNNRDQSIEEDQSKISVFKNHLKPMSKITWEAFSQIAKLTGDVDHEPNTPKSGANVSEGSDFNQKDDDDIDYDESNI